MNLTNHPPSYLSLTPEALSPLRSWLSEHPVLQNEAEAREGAALMKRGKLLLADLEDERDGLVRPLNTEVKATNDKYREARRPVEAAVEALEHRTGLWMRQEQDRRQREAVEAAMLAELAAQKAADLDVEHEQLVDSAAFGEIGLDLIGSQQMLEQAEASAKLLARDAARAERDAHVRLGVGYGNAVTLKEKETLAVADWQVAIVTLGCTERIREAILTESRLYRKTTGVLPPGIVSSITREI